MTLNGTLAIWERVQGLHTPDDTAAAADEGRDSGCKPLGCGVCNDADVNCTRQIADVLSSTPTSQLGCFRDADICS